MSLCHRNVRRAGGWWSETPSPTASSPLKGWRCSRRQRSVIYCCSSQRKSVELCRGLICLCFTGETGLCGTSNGRSQLHPVLHERRLHGLWPGVQVQHRRQGGWQRWRQWLRLRSSLNLLCFVSYGEFFFFLTVDIFVWSLDLHFVCEQHPHPPVSKQDFFVVSWRNISY